MKVRYLGHSSFLLTDSTGMSVVTDPYYDGVGYSMKPTTADIVTVSHAHKDHNFVQAVKGKKCQKPEIINVEGFFERDGIDITGTRVFHDNEQGSLRGDNIIYKFRMDGLDICHLGYIGEDCDPDLVESILPVNVLLIPVGGTYTIDAETAKEYVDMIMPEIVIPMHYRDKECELDIDKVDEFTDLFDEDMVEYIDGDEVEFSRGDIDEESTKIIVLKRKA